YHVTHGVDLFGLEEECGWKNRVQRRVSFVIELNVSRIYAARVIGYNGIARGILPEKIGGAPTDEGTRPFQHLRPQRRIERRVVDEADQTRELLGFVHQSPQLCPLSCISFNYTVRGKLCLARNASYVTVGKKCVVANNAPMERALV